MVGICRIIVFNSTIGAINHGAAVRIVRGTVAVIAKRAFQFSKNLQVAFGILTGPIYRVALGFQLLSLTRE